MEHDGCFFMVPAGGARCYRTRGFSRTGGTKRGRGQEMDRPMDTSVILMISLKCQLFSDSSEQVLLVPTVSFSTISNWQASFKSKNF